MTIVSPDNTSVELTYINSMLQKTMQNHSLALTLFKKLFLELPEQIERIENTLTAQEWQQAWEIVHKLHGSVSFCGFTELQKLSHTLEHSLLSADFQQVRQQFLLLQKEISVFQSLQAMILQYFEKTV